MAQNKMCTLYLSVSLKGNFSSFDLYADDRPAIPANEARFSQHGVGKIHKDLLREVLAKLSAAYGLDDAISLRTVENRIVKW